MGRLQISLGDLSELLRPALFALAALASAWVLHDARRRLHAYAAAAWALLALALPAVVLPLYLAARLYKPRHDREETAPPPTDDTDEADARPSPEVVVEEATGDEEKADGTPARARLRVCARRASRRGAVALAYSAAVLAAGALYFYLDYRSFDGHFARSRQAKLYNQPERTVRELRAALAVREDAHTRKLLGSELAELGRWEEALAEFRAARRGGEPDERLAYREAFALETLKRPSEAADAYQRFLQTQTCARTDPAPLCADARARLERLRAQPPRAGQ